MYGGVSTLIVIKLMGHRLRLRQIVSRKCCKCRCRHPFCSTSQILHTSRCFVPREELHAPLR
jgi:hypothetical protein